MMVTGLHTCSAVSSDEEYTGTVLIIIIRAEAREYLFTGVGLCVCVCVSVCDHDNWKDCERICTKFYGMVPREKGKTKFVFCYDW